jgi:Immunity protein 26
MGSPQITVGAVIELDLQNGYYAYGRILEGADYGIYDYYSTQQIKSLDLDAVINSPFIFIIAVYNHAINSRRWIKIGKVPSSSLAQQPLKFIQDALNPKQFSLYDPITGSIKPASKHECTGLECASVWEPEHVEERICDHYAGRPNKYRQRDLAIIE